MRSTQRKIRDSLLESRLSRFYSVLQVMAIALLSLTSIDVLASTTTSVFGTTGIETIVKDIAGLLTGTVAKGTSLIVIVGLGFAAWSGRLTGALAVKMIVGIIIILGAAELINTITGKDVSSLSKG